MDQHLQLPHFTHHILHPIRRQSSYTTTTRNTKHRSLPSTNRPQLLQGPCHIGTGRRQQIPRHYHRPQRTHVQIHSTRVRLAISIIVISRINGINSIRDGVTIACHQTRNLPATTSASRSHHPHQQVQGPGFHDKSSCKYCQEGFSENLRQRLSLDFICTGHQA